MKIQQSAAAATALLVVALNAYPQTGKIAEAEDAYHLIYWHNTGHLADYTEWWYFNLYDSSSNVQALFTYLVTNPFNLAGGLFPLGISEMAAVAYTPGGIVNESDVYPTSAFSAHYDNADVQIGSQNAITVIDPDTYQISGASQDGRIAWNLVYRRAAPSWYAAKQFAVAAEPWQLMNWLLYMPRAVVSGTMTIDGTSYQIEAPGYHDHNWGEWNVNGVPWNWAQYSQPGLTFDLGDFPNKPGGIASVEANGQRVIFESGQFTLIHTKWAYDPSNKLFYPTQSVFQGVSGNTHLIIVMNVQQSDPLSAPIPPPKAVIYEQTVTYIGQGWVDGKAVAFTGNGFKEYTAIAQ